MNPISNQIFSHDFQKFVLQDPNVQQYYYSATEKPRPPPFEVKPSEKSAKEKKKQKESQNKSDDPNKDASADKTSK